MIAKIRARWRRKHEHPWPSGLLEWMNVEVERVREFHARRRGGRS